MRVSFLIRRPGILVGDDLSGHDGRMRPNAPASPVVRFAETGRPESVTARGLARPHRWRLAATGVDQIASMPTNDSYVTAEVAIPITAN
jgi:hypothetical protein